MRDAGLGTVPYAIDTMREEEPPVGVYQPPCTVDFLGAEVAGRLELRSAGPSAPGVAVCGRSCGIGCKPCRYVLACWSSASSCILPGQSSWRN